MPRSVLTLILVAAGIAVLIWRARKLSLRAQFLVLAAMGVSIGFVLLMIVQLPEYRGWLAALLVLVVLGVSPVAVRLFLRSLTQEDNEQADDTGKQRS